MNIIFRVKKGVNREKDDPYYYLYKVACRVAAKRMNPTFMNIDADFNKEYYDKGYMPATMGCRTYIMSNVNGEPGCKGRGNIAPTTINLPRIGIRAMLKTEELLGEKLINGSIKKYDNTFNELAIKTFFNLFDEKIELETNSLCTCGAPAKFNARKVDGVFTMKGDEIEIDGASSNVEYVPLCGACFYKKVYRKGKK